MSLRLIKAWGPCPPDGYRYVFPEDGFVAHAWTYVDWVQMARNHFKANKREIPLTLEDDMQQQLCMTLPPGWCLYDDDNRPRPTVSLGWNDVVEGLKTLGRFATQGAAFVDQKEAERRALICSRCYLNVHVQGCSACQKLIAEVVGTRSTKYDFSLKGCAVCKCVLRAKVHFPISALDTANEQVQQMYPEFCWQKQGSENYRG